MPFATKTSAFPSYGTPTTTAAPIAPTSEARTTRAGEVDHKLYAWSRWAAKWIDTSVFALGLVFALSIFQYDWYASSADAEFFLIFVVSFPFWDGILVALAGGTPGRAAFRFRICKKTSDQKPGIGDAVGRAWGAWCFGCGFGIPIVAIITEIMSKNYLEEKGESRWDANADTVVEHQGPRWWSWALFIVVFVGMLSLNVLGRSSSY